MRVLLAWFVLLCLPVAAQETLRFDTEGYTNHGIWTSYVTASPASWTAGDSVTVSGTVWIKGDHLASLATVGYKATGVTILVTAERTFDAEGRMRLASDERMSTILTPAGLAIEGGVQGAVTKRFGYGFATPFDQMITLPLAGIAPSDGWYGVPFEVRQSLPQTLPPGIYRLRIDYGISTGKNNYSLNGEAFAKRPFFKGRPVESHHYSPIIRASGVDVSGREMEAAGIKPRIPWVLLASYNSNGYRGVVADEDQNWFALSQRNLIQDDVILPMFDALGRALSYSLEPQVPPDTIEARGAIPWDGKSGEITIEVTRPDGVVSNLGTAPFVEMKAQWPTTKKTGITAWKPAMYGRYTVKATGWYADERGNRYEAGGTYRFWIAKRMTLATATFQGMAYPVGNRYGRDIGFAPAFPANVEVTAALFVNSDRRDSRVVRYSGKASPAGIFGTAQGMQPLVFDAPGEYSAQVLAQHLDKFGHLWVCSMRHSGIVYQPDSPIEAHGKKFSVKGKLVDRGETNYEGYVDEQGEAHLVHIDFPYNQGDVLLIASDGGGANKIEPVLTYSLKQNPVAYDTTLQGIGRTNLRLTTSNGYSPHLFPEYITDWMYYYAGAPRPGFMSRFLVAEDGTRAPYWPTSPNSFGGQINASNNGDLPGDIYRLIGGVVVRKQKEAALYAGYLASAFILPKGTNNNRVVAPGAEDLPGPHRTSARVFLVGTRPGMTYETGTAFAPALQIDPVLPVNITFALEYPDGRKVTASGTGDSFGSFVGKDRWTLDTPGLYRYKLEGEWEGHRAVMPGLPAGGGEFYVIEKPRPPGVPELKLNLPEEFTMDPVAGVLIKGQSTAKEVYYAAVIPGAVLDQGYLPVKNGSFEYLLSPKAFAIKTQTYDIEHRVTKKAEIFDVIHLTFFSKEQGSGGAAHSFKRVIVRGTKVLCTE